MQSSESRNSSDFVMTISITEARLCRDVLVVSEPCRRTSGESACRMQSPRPSSACAGLAHVENARWFRIPKKSVEWTGSALSSWRSPTSASDSPIEEQPSKDGPSCNSNWFRVKQSFSKPPTSPQPNKT